MMCISIVEGKAICTANKKRGDIIFAKENVRRFTFRIYLTDGRHLDILRECDRPKPPEPNWVLNDQREIMTASYNAGWTRIKTIEGVWEQVQTSHIVSVSLIDVKEGIDLSSVKERYGIKG